MLQCLLRYRLIEYRDNCLLLLKEEHNSYQLPLYVWYSDELLTLDSVFDLYNVSLRRIGQVVLVQVKIILGYVEIWGKVEFKLGQLSMTPVNAIVRYDLLYNSGVVSVVETELKTKNIVVGNKLTVVGIMCHFV